MSGLFEPKGGKTTQSTQVQQVPQYAQDAQQNTLNYGKTILGSVLNAGTPQYTQAGYNSDQSGAYDLTRYLAQQAFTPSNNNVPTGSGYTASTYAPQIAGNAASYDPRIAGDAAVYDPRIAGNAQNYGAATATAARVDPADFQQFMNPYIQSVIDPAVANLRRQSDISSAQIGAQSAAAGSFGGSREAIRQGQNTRALGEQTSQLVSQLMSQGYSQAQALAQANAQMQQQTNLSNQSSQNQAGQFNAGANNSMAQYNSGVINQAAQTNANATNQMAQYNSGAINQAGQFNANAANTFAQANANTINQAGQTNAAAQNTAGQFNATQGMQAAQIRDALASSDQTRKMQAIQALLGIGNAQQTTAQSYLNQPLAYLQALAGITPQNYGGTTTSTQPNTAQSPLQTLLGIGTSLGGAVLGGKL